MRNEQAYERIQALEVLPIEMAHVIEGFTPENGCAPAWGIDVSDFSAVPFPDLTEVVYRLFFHRKDGKIVRPTSELTSGYLGNPGSVTWEDLRNISETLIWKSGDAHHILISSFEDMGKGVYQLHTES
jgi:hypothetical protein